MARHPLHLIVDWAAGLYTAEEAKALGLRGDRLWERAELHPTGGTHFFDHHPWRMANVAAKLLGHELFPDVHVQRYTQAHSRARSEIRAFETTCLQPPQCAIPNSAEFNREIHTVGDMHAFLQTAILALGAGDSGLSRPGAQWARWQKDWFGSVPQGTPLVFAHLCVDLEVLLPCIGVRTLTTAVWDSAMVWAVRGRKKGRLPGLDDTERALVPLSRLTSLALVVGPHGVAQRVSGLAEKRHIREFLVANRVAPHLWERMERRLPMVLSVLHTVATQPVTVNWTPAIEVAGTVLPQPKVENPQPGPDLLAATPTAVRAPRFADLEID
jgi:hypothetical protein